MSRKAKQDDRKDGGGKTIVKGALAFVEGQVSIVRGATVRQIRAALLDSGHKGSDFRIQGVDVDTIDPQALGEVVGGDEAVRSLPIVVVGVGPDSLGRALGALDGVEIRPGVFSGPPSDFITLPTLTVTPGAATGPVAATITVPTITVTGTTPGIFDPRDPIIVEGLTRAELEGVLLNANLDLDRVRLRPVGEAGGARRK